MYCRPSSYNNYSNLFFTHVHARLSKRERPDYFWNGLDRTTRGARLSSNFQRASALLTIICISLFYVSFGILLLVPTKIVIGNYLPSSHTLPLRAQILVSQANIISRDALLQSLLSCLFGWSYTSKSLLHHQPKRYFNPGYHKGLEFRTVSHTSSFLVASQPFAGCLHWVPIQLYYTSIIIIL